MTSHIYNKQALNNFASGMMDIQIARNPLASEVILIFNDTIRDHYQDAVSVETLRVKKRALVKKNSEMAYVQQEPELLLEDDIDKIPWIVSLTTTCLPRVPKLDDQIVIEGLRYNISYVAPANRYLDKIINLTIYPERNDVDPLMIYSVTDLEDGYYDIVYGGNPKYYSYQEESIYDPCLRRPFTSRPLIEDYSTIYLFDDSGNHTSFGLVDDEQHFLRDCNGVLLKSSDNYYLRAR